MKQFSVLPILAAGFCVVPLLLVGQLHVLFMVGGDESSGHRHDITLQAEDGAVFELWQAPANDSSTAGTNILDGLQSGAWLEVQGREVPQSQLPGGAKAILVSAVKQLRDAPSMLYGGDGAPTKPKTSTMGVTVRKAKPNPRSTTQLSLLVLPLDFECDSVGAAASHEVRDCTQKRKGGGSMGARNQHALQSGKAWDGMGRVHFGRCGEICQSPGMQV